MKAIKITAVLLIIVMLFCTACGKSGTANTANAAENTNEKKEENKSSEEDNGLEEENNEEVKLVIGEMPQTGMVNHIPREYLNETSEQGKLDSTAYDAVDYSNDNKIVRKCVRIYLPYGYDPDDKETKYNVVYLMHGFPGNTSTFLNEIPMKNILDNMIEKGDIKPAIFVFPTYNDFTFEDFPRDFTENLIPLIETMYNTYLEDATPEGIIASRDHRVYGGFSVGAMTAWNVFLKASECVRYFMPMADIPAETDPASVVDSLIKEKKLDEQGYFIFHMCGSDEGSFCRDFAKDMIDKGYTADHYVFYERGGGTHQYVDVQDYIYTALPVILGDME